MGIMTLLIVAGCTSFREGYTTNYGLANPDTPPVNPDLVGETYGSGTIGQKQIEEYEEKYNEQDIYKQPEQEEPSEEQAEPAE